MPFALAQEAALQQAASMQEALLRSEAESAAQLAAESARRAQAEEAVEQYIAAHYASQAAAQVRIDGLSDKGSSRIVVHSAEHFKRGHMLSYLLHSRRSAATQWPCDIFPCSVVLGSLPQTM